MSGDPAFDALFGKAVYVYADVRAEGPPLTADIIGRAVARMLDAMGIP